ncbi:MAG: hypothetical protein ABSB41_17630 [Anaerolineales bacterium]|jgi:hypothetical protein
MKTHIWSAVLILLLITACNGTFEIGLEHTPVSPTSVLPSTTPTLILPSSSPTLMPPSPTFQIVATTMPTPTNIALALGTTAAVEQGTIQPGQVVTYTLYAQQSQPLILLLGSPNNDVTLGVFEPNGSKLLDPANQWTRWEYLLPRTEMYTIQVIGGAMTENYTLTIKVAQVVNFAAGTTSITLTGSTINGYVFSYGLYCLAGQTMTASLNVSSSTAYIDIFGIASGTILGAAAKASTWTGVLQESQEYVIEVVPSNGQVVNYSLQVSIH